MFIDSVTCSHQTMDDRSTEAKNVTYFFSVGLDGQMNDISKLLSYFRPNDLPQIYGGQCECEGGCVLGRAAANVGRLKTIHY